MIIKLNKSVFRITISLLGHLDEHVVLLGTLINDFKLVDLAQFLIKT